MASHEVLTIGYRQVFERPEKKEDPDEITLWFNVPYIGSTGETLIKALRKKMTRLLNTKKKIKTKTFFKA